MSEKKYIDADALYEMARTNPNYKDFCRSQADLTSLRELLDEYPAADVEPVVRGEWKELPSEWNRETDELLMPRNECSVCHKWIECYKNYNFCPHCGARMERSGSGE